MGELAVVVEAEGLNLPIVILFELNLMLYHFHASLEDAFIFDSLTNGNFASATVFQIIL